MKTQVNLFRVVVLILVFFTTSIKATITNKILVSVGNEIITEYDAVEEITFLNIFSKEQVQQLGPKETKKIAIDSLIDEKIKLIALAMYPSLIIKERQINESLIKLARELKINNIENLKIFFNKKKYNFDKLIKKIELELKWNQLIYQLNFNKIVIDKEKIDKKLKQFIANQKQEEYLLSEILIESSNKNELENKSKDAIKSIELNGFGSTVMKFSSSPSSLTGGNLGWVTQDEISEYLLKYIKKTDVGKVTDRIYVPKGIMIFKIEDKRFVEKKISVEEKMNKLIELERNKQLKQFSSSYFKQIRNNIVVKYFNE